MDPLQPKKLVLQSERHEIPRSTVDGLLEAFRAAFRGTARVERLYYERGKPSFVVERLVLEDAIETAQASDEAFLTPFEMIRQHSALETPDPEPDALVAVAKAVRTLSERHMDLTMFVCYSRQEVYSWFCRGRQDLFRPEDIWQVPLVEDPDAAETGLFVVGSSQGPLVGNIEMAVLCRMGD